LVGDDTIEALSLIQILFVDHNSHEEEEKATEPDQERLRRRNNISE